MEKSSFLVVGYFGFQNNQLDGQTVKTRSIYEMLVNSHKDKTDYFDTQILRKCPSSVLTLIKKAWHADVVFFMPGINGLRVFGILLFFLKILRGIKIHYFVVGGWLPDFLKNSRFFCKLIGKFDGVYVETHSMVEKLRGECFLQKTRYFPNFRRQICKVEVNPVEDTIKAVFLSRIILEKGIETIFELSNLLAAEGYNKILTVDFYGPVDGAISEYFREEVRKDLMFSYKGALQPEHIVQTLRNYDVFILPTWYPGEGFPGAVVDAFMAGLPVIATDWKYNSEIIEDGVTGYLFPIKNANELMKCLLKLHNNRNLFYKMKWNAYYKSLDYTEQAAEILLNQYIDDLNQDQMKF